MYNQNFLQIFYGNDGANFEHHLLQFGAVCLVQKWKEETWGHRLKSYLGGEIKKKCETIIKTTSKYCIIVKELRRFIYGGNYIAQNFNQLHDLKQTDFESIHDYANAVQAKVDKAYIFIHEKDQRNRIAVLIFFRGLREEFKKVVECSIEEAQVANIVEAELAVLMMLNKNAKQMLK